MPSSGSDGWRNGTAGGRAIWRWVFKTTEDFLNVYRMFVGIKTVAFDQHRAAVTSITRLSPPREYSSRIASREWFRDGAEFCRVRGYSMTCVQREEGVYVRQMPSGYPLTPSRNVGNAPLNWFYRQSLAERFYRHFQQRIVGREADGGTIRSTAELDKANMFFYPCFGVAGRAFHHMASAPLCRVRQTQAMIFSGASSLRLTFQPL